ncbi:MAG TPA: hypothetical protein VF592_05785 [Sphingomonas sp.]|jgi:hypothetical protein|uniref:hypothetical protein n=1 Tax=Sphingomonas sp. TaxID=28214 RepID=UPI002ED9E6EC
MKEAGTTLAAVGLLGFLAALFLMPTSLNAGTAYAGEVVNLSLQQRQLLVAIGSAALFVAGVILYAAGATVQAVAPRVSPAISDADEEAAMDRLGITRGAGGYQHGGFAYSTLRSAVAAAERSSR